MDDWRSFRGSFLSIPKRRSGPAATFFAFLLVCGGAGNTAVAQYTESFQAWSSTSAGAWQTQSLAGSPFNVPASAVVEVAVRNANTTNSRYGGVRAVGSSLERRFDLHEAAGDGVDVVTMHVQTDSSSQIQHYAENTTDVDFVLLGYWDCGAYVERFDTFNGASLWADQDLNTYGVSASGVAEIVMINEAPAQGYDAGVRTNGSSLERRVNVMLSTDGTDAITMFVNADSSASATIETYAGHVNQVDFYLVGYWSVPPGTYTERFADIGSPSADATWEDKDLTASGAADGDVAEILFANDWATEENQMGVRANASSVARLFNLREDSTSAGGDFGRMHALSDGSAIIEFRHQDVSDTHHFYLIGHWDVGVLLFDHPSGQQSDAFTEQGAETNAELFAFNFLPCSGSQSVTQVVFRLTNIVGLVNGDWAGVELVVDSNGDGNIGLGETTTVGGAGTVNQAAGTITFSSSFTVSASTNYILRADFASLSLGDQVTIGLAAADISQPVTGSTTSVTHKEKIDCYFEKFETWSATSADTWETKDLAASPFSVPANAVVEIAIRNDHGTTARYGGVRAVGSSIDRRINIRTASVAGVQPLVMHVQTDASSDIQHYSDATADVDFVLLGYWTCGTYVERLDNFTAGASAAWTDKNLCSYGVGPGHVAEIVMTNVDTANGRSVGVRTNGSSVDRRFSLDVGWGSAFNSVTMFVEADTSATSTIEVYAQDDTDVSFNLVGYWSEAPLAYTETFADVGSPTASATWQDKDLTAYGVPDTGHAEFVLANEYTGGAPNMGVRENGSSLSRYINPHLVFAGNATVCRMHVATDATATMEWYHSDITRSNSFYLVGWWAACSSTSNTYVISDLGAITGTQSSLAYHVNSTNKVAGFEEDSNGNPVAWFEDCGTITALGALGGSYAESHGINDSNRVVGWAHNASGKRRAFTWVSPTMTDLGVVSGRTDSEALSVNASAEVVGTVMNFGSPPSNRLAFLYLPVGAYALSAGMNSLGTLGGTQSVGMDINDSGQVVGGAQNASGYFRPFRWQNGTMTNLGTLGGESILSDHRAEAINNSGDVCGRSYTSGGARHAFIWDGSMTDLGVLTGGTESWAFGLNDSQIIVGTSDVTGGAYHAFIWDTVNGMRDLNDLLPGGSGWTLSRATDINNDGSIVGWGTNGSGNVRAFQLTPTCKVGGGAAAASATVASGGGVTDEHGTFIGAAIDSQGVELARVEVVMADTGISVDYQVIEPTDTMDPMPEPGVSTRSGFVGGIGLSRTLRLQSSAEIGATEIVVRMNVAEGEIADLGVAPQELELHVFEAPPGGAAKAWVPAGKNVGDSLPTGVLGESGFTTHNDTVEYWAVRDGGGVFAVGKGPDANPDVAHPAATRRPCGIAMIQPLLFCCIVLCAARHSRRTRRTT